MSVTPIKPNTLKDIEEEARKEIREESLSKAKGRIATKLRAISAAKAVVANLEREYEALLREVDSDLGA